MENEFSTIASYRKGFIGIGKKANVIIRNDELVLINKKGTKVYSAKINSLQYKRMQWAVPLYSDGKLVVSLNFNSVSLNPLALIGIMRLKVGDINGFVHSIESKGAKVKNT